jgi:hypothetical protein
VMVKGFPIVDSPNGPKVHRVRLREMAEALLREPQYNRPRNVSGSNEGGGNAS